VTFFIFGFFSFWVLDKPEYSTYTLLKLQKSLFPLLSWSSFRYSNTLKANQSTQGLICNDISHVQISLIRLKMSLVNNMWWGYGLGGVEVIGFIWLLFWVGHWLKIGDWHWEDQSCWGWLSMLFWLAHLLQSMRNCRAF